jgi:hypothetical protein
VFDYTLTLEDVRRRRRRKRWVIAGLVTLLVLLVLLASLASIESPDFTIQSMSVDRINIPGRVVYIAVVVAVDNNNGVAAHLLSVEGNVLSGGKKIGDFESTEEVEISPYTNFTIPLEVAIRDAPLPLPDPVLVVNGKAHLRVILGITYHFSHTIPLTYDPDQVNAPPVADIDAPRYVRRDKVAIFDGTASYDPDGSVVGWFWDFGDGRTADGATAEHSFLAGGVYEVKLTVVDQMGERAVTTASIRVLLI